MSAQGCVALRQLRASSNVALACLLLRLTAANLAMKKKRLVVMLAGVWGAVVVYLLSGATELSTTNVREANRRRLESAMWMAEANYGDLRDVGAASLSPSFMAQQLVAVLNAAHVPADDDLSSFSTSKIPAMPRSLYVLGKPTTAWQVAVIPDEQRQLVRVEGYGSDLEHPLIVKELALRR